MISVPRVHAVTDDEVLLRDEFLQQAKSVMAVLGRDGAVHLRGRWLSSRRMYELALWLAGWERETGCWAVVNDRLDIARAAEIETVQLTSRSVTPADARQLNPAFRVGASVHTPDQAIAAERNRADWCVAGSAFPTASHPGEPAGGPELMAAIARAVSVPVIVIGGVVPAAVPDLTRGGAHGVATISGVWHEANPAEAARRYLSMYDDSARGC